MTSLIGLYTARYRGETRITQYHLIESLIADRRITHCGRQLGERDGTSLTVVVAPPAAETCKRCVPKAGFASGGRMPAGPVTYLVGESGPETLIPAQTGTKP